MSSISRTSQMLGAILGMAFASVASATPLLQQQFKDVCKPPAGSMLDLAQCRTCHSALPKLNPFGRDVRREMVRQKSKTFTPAIWKKLAPLDSDKDGASNGREIEAGTLPGNRKSRAPMAVSDREVQARPTGLRIYFLQPVKLLRHNGVLAPSSFMMSVERGGTARAALLPRCRPPLPPNGAATRCPLVSR